MRFVSLMAATLSFLSSFSYAEPVSLFNSLSTPSVLPGYTESLNRAVDFYTWQNSPDLGEYLNSNGVSSLCIPSAMSTNLLYQYAKKVPRADQIKLDGMSSDGLSADPALVVKGLIANCGFRDTNNINPYNGAVCLAQIYQNSGYQNSKVTFIRKDDDGIGSAIGFEHQDRVPEIKDIYQALKNGDEVIASVAIMKWNSKSQTWSKVTSHAINLFGYSRNPNDENSKLIIYYSNPTRRYNKIAGNPIFEIAELNDLASSIINPAPYTSIQVSQKLGRLIEYPNATTFLAGLIITHVEK